MKLFDVYNLFQIEPVKAQGCYLWDRNGTVYLDFYGGHAVISIGHSHPYYTHALSKQLHRLGFYSNSVINHLQTELAEKLGQMSGYANYQLFLCNSGAEANENALKLASFQNGRKKIVAFRGSFHGRTSAAVAATDNPTIRAPLNNTHEVIFLPLNDRVAIEHTLLQQDICAVIIEGIQGVGGVHVPEKGFLQFIRELCTKTKTFFILDEVQSGYGRSGKFFAHQYANIQPDLITVAKGMGNGFPIGGVLIHPNIKPMIGILGTTFGGNHLACAAGLAVLNVIEKEDLINNAKRIGNYLMKNLKSFNHKVAEVRGIGLMIGLEFPFPCADLRKELLNKHKIFTGSSSNKNTIRLLPPLSITQKEADIFLNALDQVLKKY